MGIINNENKKRIIRITAAAVAVCLAISVFTLWFSAGYHADTERIAEYCRASRVEMREVEGALTVFGDPESEYGFILYPGAMVDHYAYAPLTAKLASYGVLCVITDMPLDLAILNPNAADKAVSRYGSVKRWYIGGHSLGGVMAARYAAGHAKDVSGIVLLAAYSDIDVSQSGLRCLSVYGSRDGVMNREKYGAYRDNLPADLTEYVIDGGNHAGFGMYGAQRGDGVSALRDGEQTELTAGYIYSFIKAGD